MQNTMIQDQTQESVEQITDRLVRNGLKCYVFSGCRYILWLPWKQKTFFVGDTPAAKRHLEIADGRLASNVAFRCVRYAEFLEPPDRIVEQFPMPYPASGELYPSKKDMLLWTKSVLQQIDKQKGNMNAN